MRQSKLHRCSNCGHEYEVPRLSGALRRLLLDERRYVGVQEFTHVTCPKCGHSEEARERKFFGVIGPKGLQILMAIIILGVIIAVVFSLQ